MPTPNQLHVTRDDITITEQDLVEIPKGTVTEDGIRKHQCWYFIYGSLVKRSWLSLYNLMEDAATAEISRTQVWQWLHNEVVIEGRTFNMTLYKDILMMK
jgi:malate synthase